MTEAEPDFKALFIETLARLEALEGVTGDFGGPFHPAELEDVVLPVQWIHAVHSEEPDWERDNDPVAQIPDEVFDEAYARGRVLVDRLRSELEAYHQRVGRPWSPWWRRTPSARPEVK